MENISPLLTDFYQLTMANAYLSSGMAEREAVFQLFFRKAPFGGAFAIACGLSDVVRFIENFHFSNDDIDYLRSLKAPDKTQQFSDEFLAYLRTLRPLVDVDAVLEGTPVFAGEPVLRVRGPLLHCQLLETTLLTIINFQTLIATKAARIRFAAKNDEVIEFGLRRAQGIDGGISASRAAFVGGCNATSNVLAGKRFAIPVKGTMAHSFVMAFDSELDAFSAYARALPHNSLMLVDTYDTIGGLKSAIAIGKQLKARGQKFLGIRLDSGKIDELSVIARTMLDQANLRDATIVASGDLDEYEITRLKAAGAPVDVWGVGTRLVTGYDEPALGGIYKLCAVAGPNHDLQDRIKLSNDPKKATLPGVLEVRRYVHKNTLVADLLHPLHQEIRPTTAKKMPVASEHVDLIKPLIRRGLPVAPVLSLDKVQKATLASLAQVPENYRRLKNPDTFPVLIDEAITETAARLRKTYESTYRR